MNVLFLDVDGVLNSAAWFASQPPMSVTEVDARAVRRVQRIIARTGAKVVLSSSWRHTPELIEQLRAAGVPIDDVTGPRSPHGNRGVEIADWLRAHPEVTTFAIVDDDADAGDCAPERFVRTYWRTGMYGKHERAIIELLVGEARP